MKMVKAIVRPDCIEPLKDEILKSDIGGMTVSAVHGCGKQNGWKEYFRGNEVIMNVLPKIKCEFAVTDDKVDELIELIVRVCRTGEVGDGKIFVMPIEQVVRIRTGESGDEAL
jgi:nitrogen regulatory protein P-II 1